MLRPNRLNRIATIATLPLMAIVIVYASRAISASQTTADLPREGHVVVANLRGETLSILSLAGGQTHTLALPGPPHEMAFANGRLYVTLGRANLLLEVDPYAPGILRSLELEGEPHGLAIDGDTIYVTLDRASMLVSVDRGSLTETARAPTGSTPHTVAVANGVIYVTDSRDDRLRRIPGDITVETGRLPESVAVVGEAVVTADAASGALSVFSLDALRLERRIDVKGRPVRVIALSDRLALVSLNDDARVAVADVLDGKVTRWLRTGGRPDGLCLAPSGEHLAVASNESGSVSFFRTDDWTPAGSFAAGAGPGACAWIPAR